MVGPAKTSRIGVLVVGLAVTLGCTTKLKEFEDTAILDAPSETDTDTDTDTDDDPLLDTAMTSDSDLDSDTDTDADSDTDSDSDTDTGSTSDTFIQSDSAVDSGWHSDSATGHVSDSAGSDSAAVSDSSLLTVDSASFQFDETGGLPDSSPIGGETGELVGDSGLIRDSAGLDTDVSSVDSGSWGDTGILYPVDSGIVVEDSSNVVAVDSGESGRVDSARSNDSGQLAHSGLLHTDSGMVELNHSGDTGSSAPFFDYLKNSCAELAALPTSLSPGHYLWPTTGYSNSSSLTSTGCTGATTDGIDGMLRIDLQPGETLELTYRLLGGDGSVYLLTDCLAVTSCVAGSDDNWTIDGSETLTYQNVSGSVQTYTLVLDEYDYGLSPSAFELGFAIF